MPKGKKVVDDLDEELEGDEEETEDEEEAEEETDEESEDDSDEAEEVEEEKPKKRGRPKGSTNGKVIKKGKLIGVVLVNGIPKRVQIIKVMGRNIRATKVGDKTDDTGIRIPISEVFEHDEDIFNKMKERAEKIKRLIDANISDAANRLRPIASPRGAARKGNPLDSWD